MRFEMTPADECAHAAERDRRRKSIDSTPCHSQVRSGFGDISFEPVLAQGQEQEESAAILDDEAEEVIVEDSLDAPSGEVGRASGPLAASGLGIRGAPGSTSSKGGGASPLASSRSGSSPGLLPAPRKRRCHSAVVPQSPSNKFNRRAQAWDTRFHLVDDSNQLKPKKQRNYFSRPASLPDLQNELRSRGVQEAKVNMLAEPEVKARRPEVPLSADPGPPVIPSRYRIGGLMGDRDASVMPWNDRWHAGVHLHNEALHPLHRAGFSRKSVFEDAKSQIWRRQRHVEVASGVWRQAPREVRRFPPIGV